MPSSSPARTAARNEAYDGAMLKSSPPLVQALVRALIGGVITAGAAFFAVYGTTGRLQAAEIAAGAAFFSQLATRGVAEGWIDQAATQGGGGTPTA